MCHDQFEPVLLHSFSIIVIAELVSKETLDFCQVLQELANIWCCTTGYREGHAIFINFLVDFVAKFVFKQTLDLRQLLPNSWHSRCVATSDVVLDTILLNHLLVKLLSELLFVKTLDFFQLTEELRHRLRCSSSDDKLD